MSFLKTVWNLIAKFFGGLSRELQTVIIPLAVAVGNAVKYVVDLDQEDIIGNIAKQFGVTNGVDVEEKVKKSIPAILQKLDLAQQFLHLNDPNLILKAVLAQIKDASTDVKTLFWTNFAALLNDAFADGKLTILEAWQAVAYYYKNHTEPTPAIISANIIDLQAHLDENGETIFAPENTAIALTEAQKQVIAQPVATIPESAGTSGESVISKAAENGVGPVETLSGDTLVNDVVEAGTATKYYQMD